MSIVLAHDAIHANVAHLPAGQSAGYTTGSADIRWTAQDWAHHPAAVRIDQDASATDLTADVLDVERGAATNSEAAHWYTMALRSFTAGTRARAAAPRHLHLRVATSRRWSTRSKPPASTPGRDCGWRTGTCPTRRPPPRSPPRPGRTRSSASSSPPGRSTTRNVFSTTWLNATSHMAGTGPFLHHADGKHSLDAIASARGTSAGHLIGVTATAAHRRTRSRWPAAAAERVAVLQRTWTAALGH